jgi:hypothetical protein
VQNKPVLYLEALDAHTNRILATELDEALVREIRVPGRDEPVRVWEASEDQASFLIRTRNLQQCGLSFHVYRDLGRGPRLVKPDHDKQNKIRATRKRVKKIKAKG